MVAKGSLKNLKKEADYWNNFYASFNLSIPSQFAVFCAVDLQRSIRAIVEIGCGNGRDALFFSEKGFDVLAIDKSAEAIHHNKNLVKKKKIQNIEFDRIDITKSVSIKNSINVIRQKSHADIIAVYSRFFLHSITDQDQDLFIKTLESSLNSGDVVYFEYRCSEDENTEKVFSNHYRRFVDTNHLSDALENHGFEMQYCISGKGMARFKSEDAYVSRLIFIKI